MKRPGEGSGTTDKVGDWAETGIMPCTLPAIWPSQGPADHNPTKARITEELTNGKNLSQNGGEYKKFPSFDSNPPVVPVPENHPEESEK